MTPVDSADRCRACGEPLAGARACPRCGSAVDRADPTAELLPERQAPSQDTLALRALEPVQFPAEVHAAHRRVLGLEPVPLLGGLSAVMLVVSVVLLAAGGWIGGIICLGFALGLFTLLVSALRREPNAPLARRAAMVRDRLAAWWRLGAVALRAGSRAAVELGRLRIRRQRLRRRLDDQLRPLGDAVLRDQLEVAEALKSRAAEIESALKAAEREAAEVAGGARRPVGRERAHVQPTPTLPVVRGPADAPDAARSE